MWTDVFPFALSFPRLLLLYGSGGLEGLRMEAIIHICIYIVTAAASRCTFRGTFDVLKSYVGLLRYSFSQFI